MAEKSSQFNFRSLLQGPIWILMVQDSGNSIVLEVTADLC